LPAAQQITKAWDKSVPSEYESVEKLYSEEKCDRRQKRQFVDAP